MLKETNWQKNLSVEQKGNWTAESNRGNEELFVKICFTLDLILSSIRIIL